MNNASAGPLSRLIRFCLEQKIVVLLLALLALGWGVLAAPFNWETGLVDRAPVPVDAIPDIGENQQIVFTEWPGRSPQDIEDQITYPLTVALLNVPHVKAVRSQSVFGFSSIYVIFDDEVDFYWSRARILEKLNSLPGGTLPEGASPALGPDATALGQIFWYTLEGRDPDGNPTGGWDPQELRSIQDWTVRYRLASADGVAEVASIGGFVREHQIDVDPDAMRFYGVSLHEVMNAVRRSNIDVGARTIEVNKAEYIVRGLGYIESLEDIRNIAIASHDDAPVFLDDIAEIGLGPALRRGALDKAGAEAVGGVVVARYGENPLEVIQAVKDRIDDIQSGLPRKILPDGTESRVTIVPFYDRTGLIDETLQTLNSALYQQFLVTIIVVVLMVMHLRSSLLISALMPMAVLLTFVAMKHAGVDANIVALSGIAIAIGTIVDMGIVLSENMLRRLDEADPDEPRLEVIHRAATEVGSAVLTAALTTIVSFLPVFALQASEGKLFRPLAFTKTFVIIAAIVLTLTVLPPAAHVLLGWRVRSGMLRRILAALVIALGAALALLSHVWAGAVVVLFGAFWMMRDLLPLRVARLLQWSANLLAVAVVLVILARYWAPLGVGAPLLTNLLFVGVAICGVLLIFQAFRVIYPLLLGWALRNKAATLLAPIALVIFGATVWLGFDRVFGWLPESIRKRDVVVDAAHALPGLGEEFMPALDEGSFLYMPTTMPHASIGESMDALRKMDMAIAAIPEVEDVVGKIGRVDSPLDPAPISMVETIINYIPEYREDEFGRRLRFAYDSEAGAFLRDERGELIPDHGGQPHRQWRERIQSPEDIWSEIAKAADIPGSTSAPRLQPIETRLIMLQTGFRASMGLKIYGPDLEIIDDFAMDIERVLREVPSIRPETVFADRVVGKPYLEIDIDRERIARYGVTIADVQEIIEVAIGGKRLTTTVEGRERYPVRVRYLRELRDQIETIGDILVPGAQGRQIPLRELAEVRYSRGPQMIKSENTFLVAYVLFDKQPDEAEVGVVEDARRLLRERIDSGGLRVPAGVSFEFGGAYENQVRAAKTLRVIIPVSLVIIFLLLYFQFRSSMTALIVFSGVAVAWSGGFLLLWLYGRDGFMDFSVSGVNMRDLFQIGPINLSVAVWVGFLALFGIATDDGVVMATRLRQSFAERPTDDITAIRAATIAAGRLRIRACLMTTATTILALLPVLTSTGRGSDVMVPMAVPIVGGMLVELVTLFVVPTLYCTVEEWKLRMRGLRSAVLD